MRIQKSFSKKKNVFLRFIAKAKWPNEYISIADGILCATPSLPKKLTPLTVIINLERPLYEVLKFWTTASEPSSVFELEFLTRWSFMSLI